jgi:uncharacterized membrane protein YgcG
MAWQQIAGLVALTLIVLVCLWPLGRRKRNVRSDAEEGDGGPSHRGGQGGGGTFGGAGATGHWSDHGGAEAGGHEGH